MKNKKINNVTPQNACGNKIFFWLEGNTTKAKTRFNENFDYIDPNAQFSNKLLTYAYWRECEQDQGYTELTYSADYKRSFKVLPDGTVPEFPNGLPGAYQDAILVPPTPEEMEYIKSKYLVPLTAENIVEYRYLFDKIYTSHSIFFKDIQTNQIKEIILPTYNAKFDAYDLSDGTMPLLKTIVPATAEELAGLKMKAQQLDLEAVSSSKAKNINLPNLPSEDAKKSRENYLNSHRNNGLDENQPQK